MSGFTDLETLRELFASHLENTGSRKVNLKECEFVYEENVPPYLEHAGQKFTIDKTRCDWVVKQLCKLIGVTTAFYDRNPDKLSEEVFKTHIDKLDEKKLEVEILFKEEGPLKIVRGLIPQDYYQLTNLELLNLVVEYFDDQAHDVFFIEGSSPYTSSARFAVMSTQETELNETVYNFGVMVRSSEVGDGDLEMTPILLDREERQFIPLLLNGSTYFKAKYINPKNGTLVEPVRKALTDISNAMNTVLPDLRTNLHVEQTFEDMVEKIKDWGTRRGFPAALSKKVDKSLTALVDTEDDNGENYRFETLGDLVELTLKTSGDSFSNLMKTSTFLAKDLGFNYQVQSK